MSVSDKALDKFIVDRVLATASGKNLSLMRAERHVKVSEPARGPRGRGEARPEHLLVLGNLSHEPLRILDMAFRSDSGGARRLRSRLHPWRFSTVGIGQQGYLLLARDRRPCRWRSHVDVQPIYHTVTATKELSVDEA